jgi:hypothetical protein
MTKISMVILRKQLLSMTNSKYYKDKPSIYFKVGYTEPWAFDFEDIHFYWDLVCNRTDCDTQGSYMNRIQSSRNYITQNFESNSNIFNINQVIPQKLSSKFYNQKQHRQIHNQKRCSH